MGSMRMSEIASNFRMVFINNSNDSLNAGLAKCPALNGTISEYGPMIKNGCSVVVPGTTSATTSTTSGSSAATASPSQKSEGVSKQISLFSLLAVTLLF